MKRIVHSSAAAAALISASLLPVSPALAAPAGAPAGSYQASCTVYQVNTKDQMLLAACQTKDGKTKLNRDWTWKYCTGDISNQNGMLSCPLDMAALKADQIAKAEQPAKDAAAQANLAKIKARAELVAAAKPAFNSAGQVAIGRGPRLAEPALWYDGMAAKDGQGWTMADGVSFSEAFAFLKGRLAEPGPAALRAEVIDNVYREVYGRTSGSVEQAGWDPQIRAQKAWYTTMVAAERKTLAANPELRGQMVNRTFQQAFGRDADRSEFGKWSPGDLTSGMIRGQLRAYLYSPAGAAELVATVKRALGIKGRAPDEAALKAAVAQYSASQALYSDMVK